MSETPTTLYIPPYITAMSDDDLNGFIASHGWCKTVGYTTQSDPVSGAATPDRMSPKLPPYIDHPDKALFFAENRRRSLKGYAKDIYEGFRETSIFHQIMGGPSR